MNYPDSFSFYHAGTTQQYNMQRVTYNSAVPLWACSEDGDKFRGATYTAGDIAGHFGSGAWQEVPKERELVFPFTVQHTDSSGAEYTIFDSTTEGMTHCYEAATNRMDTDYFSYSDCRRFITEGLWRVTSVGHQKPAEVPTSPPKDLVVSVDSEQLALATERANALAQAVENVNISLEAFQGIFADVQNMLMPQQFVACDVDFHQIKPFCCEEG